MKNLKLVFLILFFTGFTFSQSKKEIIVILNNRIDSLKRILDDEKQLFVIYEIKNQDLTIKIESLELFKKSSLNLLETEKKRLDDELNSKNNKSNH